ncbi:TonB-dependent receptor [Phenylobacterium sp. LjRoot225]|uniref:TonB-dependent receptor n=1 Tax=Phenylobacterium sp. LjRoot225 TaxID=3342285 RepID=UPI003ECC21D5
MGKRPRGQRAIGLAASLILGLPATARASDPVFAIPKQPRESALLALAQEAGLSLGFAPDAHCAGHASLSGAMSVDRALDRLLAGSACRALRPDARTIVIRARPDATASSPAEPAALPAPAVEPRTVAELVVTADKTPRLLSAAPYALTAATDAELGRAGVADDESLPLLAAGVTVTNLGPGRDKILLRGLSDGPLTGHTQSTVGLYLGDLRLTYNAPDPDLPLIDIERIEVLRGPQGSLYGAGSIGGVLQITPNAPDTRARSGRVTASLSSTAHGSPSHQLQGLFNQPFAGGDAAVRVVAWSERTGGYIDNPARGRKDVNRSRRSGVRLAAVWRPAADLDLALTVIDQNIDTRDAQYADPVVGPLARRSEVAEPHDNDFRALDLGLHWEPSWGRLTASLGALDHDVGTTYDATAAPFALAPPGASPPTFQDRNEIRTLVAETRLASTGPGRFHWTIGAFAAFGDQRLDGKIIAAGPAGSYLEIRRDDLRERAVFGETSYDLTSRLTLSAGGRLFDSRLKTYSQVSVDGPVRAFSGRSSYKGFAPKLLAAYRPRSKLTLYAQAAEGYRTPGFNTAGAVDQAFAEPGGVQPLRRYAGDELWSYELGGRWRSPALGLSLRAVAFQADWTDIQANQILPSGLPFTANLGDGRSRGVEAEASYVRGRLALSGNIVQQDSEVRSPAPGLAIPKGSGLPGMPDRSFALSAAYSLPLRNDWSLELRTSFTYVGRSTLALDAAASAAMGGYGDLGAAATLSSANVRARLFVRNLLDEHGDTLAFGNPFAFRTQAATTPQRPRTLGVEVSRAF